MKDSVGASSFFSNPDLMSIGFSASPRPLRSPLTNSVPLPSQPSHAIQLCYFYIQFLASVYVNQMLINQMLKEMTA